MWWIFALFSAFFGALTAILGKIGVSGIDSNIATAIRTVVILIVAWGIVFAVSDVRTIGTISRRSLVFLVLSGITTGLSWLCYYRALKEGKASAVAPIDKSSLVMVILLAAVFLDEPLTWKSIVGSILIVCGMLVTVLPISCG
ncbi:MAG: putative rane protein [Chlorobi bacterium]|nr:putative rane protein [Chlorobiota bacterium]